ncbi:MAG: aminopeptidase P family protein [Elusimicrobia bacterium]|nr:aminopeptidase P family protein [Elusimicrobiota bacterium]
MHKERIMGIFHQENKLQARNKPDIKKDRRQRRKQLARRLADGFILIAGSKEAIRSNDNTYPFHQLPNFFFLTGIDFAGCWLLIEPKSGAETLFIPRIDNYHRVWLGHIPGPEEIRKYQGISRVLYVDDLVAELRRVSKNYKHSFCDLDAWKTARPYCLGVSNDSEELEDALWELRAVKKSGELECLKIAGALSSKAHLECMKKTRPGLYEYQIQAVFDGYCLAAGLKHLGYPTIVGSGRNSAVLHYRDNSAQLKNGDLLLIDAGGEYLGYSADITRTYPINGKFSPKQRDIYEIALKAQVECINRARPGVTSADLHVHASKVIAEGLSELKILKGSIDDLVHEEAVRVFFPHGIGHLLGLDVHDGQGGKRRALPNPYKLKIRYVAKLEPGFVITVEPGIYFIEALLNDSENRERHKDRINFDRAESFLSVGGVRIEDDVVIQRQGMPLNLTNVPKSIDDVEAVRHRPRLIGKSLISL